MKRALCAILLAILVPSTSTQAGYAGQVALATGSGAGGSLATTGSGTGSDLVGTNLAAPVVTPLGSVPGTTNPIGGYFDFNTGAYAGTDAAGNTMYGPGGNFFVLNGPLSTSAGSPPVVSSLTTGDATVTALGITTAAGDAEYELTMAFTGGYLSDLIAQDFGVGYLPLTDGRVYSGTLDFIFVNNHTLGGDQLLSGTITFNSVSPGDTTVPEPSSLVMLVMGGAGVLGYGGFRRRRRPA
jgi:hypothetical protein